MSDASRADGDARPVGSDNRQAPKNFITGIIDADIASGKWGLWRADEIKPGGGQKPGAPKVCTRFPPEPNGYLHIGHAKSICLNYGLAAAYGGRFNLRFDDTNPAKEEAEYVESIKRDVKWLGGDYDGPLGGGVLFASNYFGRMYEFAQDLIRKGKAYVCDLSAEQVAQCRGIPQKPGRDSPYRTRSADESLDLLARMKAGEFPNGSRTLRAKIDMTSPNLNLRDPVLYRILHEEHHNTGGEWCIYPMYDWAHGFEDSIEGITHSICTLEFENHRPLYDWFIDAVNEGRSALRADASTHVGSASRPTRIHHPQQIEFARLNLNYTVLSKRKLIDLVQGGHVTGWDDPRMPTISGYRRRGYTPEAIRAFCDDVGVTRVNSVIDVGRLENAVRDDLNRRAPRRMGVLNPLKVVIENYPQGQAEHLPAVNNPEDPSAGTRPVPFSRELYIEREDFMEDPPKKYFRLAPGREVRLRSAYFITCTGIVKDADGNITELRCTYDPATRGGDSPDGRKVKATLHWVSAGHALDAKVHLLDRLFTTEEPGKRTGNYLDDLNPSSLSVARARVEPSLGAPAPDEPEWPDGIRRFQFERLGYFAIDPGGPAATSGGRSEAGLVFNRTATLRDTWAREAARA
ncbi:MAG: glutamine--tRNA ligase/YqeY domain fusion protein [Phycisphaerales bacterium]|nr:glutamine--tRNA ligase/YqeY domain fusion protein [Phycisphaerales bacterium]